MQSYEKPNHLLDFIVLVLIVGACLFFIEYYMNWIDNRKEDIIVVREEYGGTKEYSSRIVNIKFTKDGDVYVGSKLYKKEDILSYEKDKKIKGDE